MRGNKSEGPGDDKPAPPKTRRVEQDINDVNRRNLEIDKYLAAQGEVPDVGYASKERKIRLSQRKVHI